MSITIPTKAGYYESAIYPTDDGEYDPYFCDGHGNWFEVNESGHNPVETPADYAPFYPLIPLRMDAGHADR